MYIHSSRGLGCVVSGTWRVRGDNFVAFLNWGGGPNCINNVQYIIIHLLTIHNTEPVVRAYFTVNSEYFNVNSLLFLSIIKYM